MATTDMNDEVKKVLAMVPQGHKADHAQLWAHLQILATYITEMQKAPVISDDMKAAVERFRGLITPFSDGYVRVVSRSCGGYNAHNYNDGVCQDCGFDGMVPTGEMMLGEAQDLLAHIDGEDERVRVVLNAQLARLTREFSAETAAAVAAANARWEATFVNHVYVKDADYSALVTERAALKEKLAAELESSQAVRRDVVSLTAQVEALMPLEAERDTLRAQVEASRATLALFADAGFWSWEYRWTGDDTKPPFEVARDALAAMDGAKP